MTAWKSRSKIASSAVASPPAIILRVQGGEEGALVVVAGAVGVVGERGLLRQRGQPGEQRGGGVGQQQVVDVGDPAGAGEFERQQRQQPAGGGHDPGAGVAGAARPGRAGRGRPGRGSAAAARPCRVSTRSGQVAKSSRGGAGQPGVAAGGGRAVEACSARVAQQPAEAFLGEDLRDAGAVQRGAFGGQPARRSRRWTGPARRSSITRPRARSLAGATPGGGPGLRGGANSSSSPARYSRTRLTIAQRV